jgi:hypothetical protein
MVGRSIAQWTHNQWLSNNAIVILVSSAMVESKQQATKLPSERGDEARSEENVSRYGT